ncbi:MAG: DUF881 domain-containing protein [Anaerolineae bacterium]|nr:MAG: DUF881 domain-containing protein [Anaerolineae bacterium]
MSNRTSQLILTVASVLLGILVMAQLQTHGLSSKTRASASSADQSLILSNLVEANASLRAEVETLETQLNRLQSVGSSGLLETMVEELNRLKTVNGLVQVSGPGLEVRLSGPLSVLNAQDLANELRNAGAEAIALNGERLVLWSAIAADDEGWLTVDGTRLASPYTFQAIGDGETMETALMRSGGLMAVLEHSYEGLEVQVRRHSKLVLSVHRYPPEFQYASFGE